MKESNTQNSNGSSKYWLSLDQWRNDPEFKKMAENEFLSSPLADDEEGGWARREFLKLMGASMALTTAGCLRRPAQKIVPYAKRPSEIVPGLPNYYASSFSDGIEGFGIVVKTREGRPIKIEGNEIHPVNQGGLSARAHSHVLSLYDPDRLTGPRENLLNPGKTNKDTVSISFDNLDKAVVDRLKNTKVALLTAPTTSPSTKALVEDFKSAFSAQHVVWNSAALGSVLDAAEKSFGRRGAVPRLSLDKADYIVSVDGDILGTWLSTTQQQADFGKRRTPGPEMSKLVSFESLLSLTGANADERFRIKPSQQLDVVMGLLHSIVVKGEHSSYASNSTAKKLLEPFSNVASSLGLDEMKFKAVAEELWSHRGKSVVVAGGLTSQTGQAEKLQSAVNWLNDVLGNDGITVDYKAGMLTQDSLADLQKLIADLESGEIKTLIIHGFNPLYSLPESLGLRKALTDPEGTKKEDKKMVIYTGDRNDETGTVANFIAPDDHALEKWGDAEFIDGTYSIQQPTIRPLYDTRAFEESLLKWTKDAGRGGSAVKSADTWYDYLRNNWKNNIHARNRTGMGKQGFEEFWLELLQAGVFTASSSSNSSARGFRLSSLDDVAPATTSQGYELALYETVGLRDGSLANVSWLQEFPDPVTKICWDNYLCVSPADAEKENIKEGQVVELMVGDRKVSVPAHIQPGQADGVLGLAVGYGRNGAGKVADGVGVAAWNLSTVTENQLVASGLPATIKVSEKMIPLANVQGHHSMEGRQIVVEQTLEQYSNDVHANMHKHKIFSMYKEHEYPGHKWGMVIDQTKCTGCSACIVACQSENNIPVVGKKYVLQGREMHWIRTDRYFVGEPDNPDTVYQPLVCQHCDNAPCEAVCPVAATVHSEEGTNDMIYNRCVGTRYCSNNCPYKVRRFNWFNYVKNVRKPENYAMNPEVTVRARGVMEKCTFCVHRIKDAKTQSKVNDTPLADGDVQTACQESCPTKAILFGDLNDPRSRVAAEFHNNENNTYSLLEEWGTYPAVKYKTKVRNTDELKGSHGGHHGGGGDHGKGGH